MAVADGTGHLMVVAVRVEADRERLLTTAAAFETAGCPYQRARTLILAGGDTAPTGNAALADLGLPPAPAPPGTT